MIDRVLTLDSSAAKRLLDECEDDFGERHPDLTLIFEEHYREALERADRDVQTDDVHRQLIGAYFTMEYAYSSAALFNPSMVPAIDQSTAPPGGARFVMSVRAVGEGHVSSIVFRTGVLTGDGEISFDPQAAHSRRLRTIEDWNYHKGTFLEKLIEAGAYSEAADVILDQLDDHFNLRELGEAIESAKDGGTHSYRFDETGDILLWLARSNYRVELPNGGGLNEAVVFPNSENESNGLEDMRLVHFTDDDGTMRYFGTYTAYNGSRILPQIIEMASDRIVHVHTLGGRYAVDKGMALFPRRIDGHYAMISRVDGENIYLMRSKNVRFWNDAKMIQTPRYPWEFVQLGNCGSPIETDAGWLLLTHGVGPMRRYVIAATLLDRDDPSRVIGQLTKPLLLPRQDERSGYVPNVVYSCGGLVQGDTLVIPYGISDVEVGFATVPLGNLLHELRAS